MVDQEYLRLIESDRVSPATRKVLLERAKLDNPEYVPLVIDAQGLPTLRAVLARMVPQDGPEPIDLAARVDTMLASGGGNGWRYEVLPEDGMAIRIGLAVLDETALLRSGKGFAVLGAEAQDELLVDAVNGTLQGDLLDMGRWAEELLSYAAEMYMAHPGTFARIGYSGIGDGADAATQKGFVLIGMGEVEAWEPEGKAR
ncbi:gluconate 2-dehydrogenase subunit 3 family protein [Granulicella sibirica]|uniref:Uncharacterized protein n=1 Tax=Granulicella sibirica TaxID=2479048 RepID=A0A4Q0T7I5_9BACT|nr:gluconate 2-dehydrogenase subunit 3 family protein [Granulicella sibirica]RXH58068.1 hypothetical protein GRAN_1378 [Granulicella sibirica]